MQLTAFKNENTTNSVNTKQFSISTDASKLFHMLSSSLYTQKENAILHEIGANCVDAHVLGNCKDRPWDLVIPTSLDSHIRFRDYGPGLSEDDVYRLLTVYGASDKTGSNSFIGAYGLGAKSPAAVTKTWTVVSRHNKLKMEFFVFIDDTGTPTISKIKETQTEDESGLEVVIPVNMSQTHIWKSAIPKAFAHYDVKPNVINASISWPQLAPPIIKDNYFVTGTKDYSVSRISAIASNREYDIDLTKLSYESGLSWRGNLISTLGVHIKFNIGELDLSLSREAIQYTKHSIANITRRVAEVAADLEKHVSEHVNAATDGLDLRDRVLKLCKQFNTSDAAILKLLTLDKKFGLEKLESRDLRYYDIKTDKVKTIKYTRGSKITSTMPKHFYLIDRDVDMIRVSLAHLNELKIYIRDCKDALPRIRQHDRKGIVLDENFFPKEFDKYVIKASTLTKQQKMKVKTEEKPALWMVTNREGSIKRCEFDVKLQDKVVVFEHPNMVTKFEHDLTAAFYEAKYNILLVKPGAKIDKLEKFRYNSKFANEFIQKNSAKMESISKAMTRRAFSNSYSNGIELLKKKDIVVSDNSVFTKLSNQVKEILLTKDTYDYTLDALYNLFTRIAKHDKIVISTVKLPSQEAIVAELYEAYPLLAHLESLYRVPASIISDYVALTNK